MLGIRIPRIKQKEAKELPWSSVCRKNLRKTTFKTRKGSQEEQLVYLSLVRRQHVRALCSCWQQGWQREENQPKMGKHQNSGKRSQNYAAEICFYLFRYWIARMQKHKNTSLALRARGSGMRIGLTSNYFVHWCMQQIVTNRNTTTFTMHRLSVRHVN